MPTASRCIMISTIALGTFVVDASAGITPEINGLRFIDRYVLSYTPGFAGTVFENTLFGGISGLDFDTKSGVYYSQSDDRSQNAPPGGDPAARFYTIAIDIDDAGFVGDEPVLIQSVKSLKRPDGSAFPSAGVDPESIRVRRKGEAVSLFWTSEGAAANSSNPPLQNPFVREMNLDGAYVAEFITPEKFNPDGVGAAQTKGIRNNLSFENLTFSIDGTLVYAATESALFQDGPIATFANTATSRVVEFDMSTGEALREFVYVVDSVPVDPQGGFADNGLAELLAIGDGVFLAVERSFITGYGNHVRIYRAEIGDATDVSRLQTLQTTPFTPMSKTLLLTLTPEMGFNPDNIEAITFGPTLSDGLPTFILACDNNFNATTQVTHFLLLSVTSDGDLNGDDAIDGADLGVLLSQWGGSGIADLNGDGVVDGADLGLLLGNWSP